MTGLIFGQDIGSNTSTNSGAKKEFGQNLFADICFGVSAPFRQRSWNLGPSVQSRGHFHTELFAKLP